MHKCQSCGEPATRRCSGCAQSTAWYCSVRCQRSHWVAHIFECNPRREINTADYLALAVYQNRFPDDLQTCEDYGFTKGFTMENRQNLLGLYIGLIERLEVAPKQISRWRANGTLIEEIKAAFSKLPEGSRGGYYPWFLQNQWVLDDALTAQGDPVDEMMRGSWRYVHGPNSDTRQDIIAAMSSWPQNKKDCHMLCTLLLSDMHPAPHLPIWVNFGFCVCSDETDEGSLSSLYRQLMAKCTFDEIYAAYECSSLIALFDAKGLKPAREKICNLEDVLRGSPRNFKSVWH